jgi:hypothetical protein
MIPHHHHEILTIEFFTHIKQYETHALHHNDKNQLHHNLPDEKEQDNTTEKHHKHKFPKHFHFSASNDFDFTRVNYSESGHQNQNITLYSFSDLLHGEFSELPDSFINYYSDYPVLIYSQFKPGANALRAPPSIV